jgi:PRTRC genetic system protein C
MIKVERLERSFSYLGTRFPDPDPSMTVEQVRDVYCQKTPAMQFHPKSM